MSERKVLNKYYPPDFDPSKIPRVKCPKNRQFTVRLMAPFNMRCKTCGEYIYKGKKFNARKEDVEGEDYLGIRIFRFYIKCTRCLQEISFKTDPRNTDYEIEAGATRNFMALKLAEEQAEREEEERREEEASNPMKVLENRTKQSKHELELLEALEEIKDINRRQQSIDYNELLSQFNSKEAKERLLKLQEAEDERYVKSIFGEKRVVEEVIVNAESESKKKKQKTEASTSKEAEIPHPEAPKPEVKPNTWNKSVGGLSKSKLLMNSLVRVKKADPKEELKSATEENPAEIVLEAKNTTTELDSVGVNAPPKSNGLSLLGSYSDSDSNDSS